VDFLGIKKILSAQAFFTIRIIFLMTIFCTQGIAFSMKRDIILASRSPARYQILKEAGLSLKRAFADIDESFQKGEGVDQHALRLAVEKARKIALKKKDAIIITADTIIVLGKKILGKPKNKREAKKFLTSLSGKWHEVHTGTVVLDIRHNYIQKKLVKTRVKFVKLTPKIIDWYVSTGEPMRAAGAYSIQSKGRALVESVDGCFTNVIGISIPVIMRMLDRCA